MTRSDWMRKSGWVPVQAHNANQGAQATTPVPKTPVLAGGTVVDGGTASQVRSCVCTVRACALVGIGVIPDGGLGGWRSVSLGSV